MAPAGMGSVGSGGGVDLSVEVFGEDVVSRRLLRFAQNAEDARPAFRRINSMLEAATLKRFKSGGAYGGEKWAALKDSTIAAKRARGNKEPRSILVASGRLRASLTQETAEDSIRELLPQSMRWGSTVDYGEIHQKGNADGRPPRRRVVKLPEVVKRQIVKELQRTLVGR